MSEVVLECDRRGEVRPELDATRGTGLLSSLSKIALVLQSCICCRRLVTASQTVNLWIIIWLNHPSIKSSAIYNLVESFSGSSNLAFDPPPCFSFLAPLHMVPLFALPKI